MPNIKLKTGKSYLDAAGNIVKIIDYQPASNDDEYPFVDDKNEWFNFKGQSWSNRKWDLVEEVKKPIYKYDVLYSVSYGATITVTATSPEDAEKRAENIVDKNGFFKSDKNGFFEIALNENEHFHVQTDKVK